MLEEDGAPVALEQDHRMIDQAGQDPVEVEAAADIVGDPAERLGPVEQVGDLFGASCAADDRPETVGNDPCDLEVAGTERPTRFADDQEDAPRFVGACDGDGQLRSTVGQDGEGRVNGGVTEQDPGRWRASGPVAAGRKLERLAQEAEPTRQIRQSQQPGDVDPGKGPS